MSFLENSNFDEKDFEKALNNVRGKTIDELIDIMYNSLKNSYEQAFNFPNNCCDYSSDFGTIIFNKLGYDAEYWFANISLKERVEYGHSFVKIGNQIVDFTINQFGILKPGIIKTGDFNVYYIDACKDANRTIGNKNLEFNQFINTNNFVLMVVKSAINEFIKLNIN